SVEDGVAMVLIVVSLELTTYLEQQGVTSTQVIEVRLTGEMASSIVYSNGISLQEMEDRKTSTTCSIAPRMVALRGPLMAWPVESSWPMATVRSRLQSLALLTPFLEGWITPLWIRITGMSITFMAIVIVALAMTASRSAAFRITERAA